MFFPRLRRHAKWMFVFLALVFGVGFVVFGIGAAGSGASLGDLLREQGGANDNSISVSDAREKVQKNPKDAEAQRELATALQEDGQQDEAIDRAQRVRRAAPEGRGRAARARRPVPHARQQAAQDGPGSAGARELSHRRLDLRRPARRRRGFHRDAGSDRARRSRPRRTQQVTAASTAAQTAFQQAERPTSGWSRSPRTTRTCSSSSRRRRSRAGTTRRRSRRTSEFLKLAPDDPSAPIVKQQIKQLKAAQIPAASG